MIDWNVERKCNWNWVIERTAWNARIAGIWNLSTSVPSDSTIDYEYLHWGDSETYIWQIWPTWTTFASESILNWKLNLTIRMTSREITFHYELLASDRNPIRRILFLTSLLEHYGTRVRALASISRWQTWQLIQMLQEECFLFTNSDRNPILRLLQFHTITAIRIYELLMYFSHSWLEKFFHSGFRDRIPRSGA